MNKGRRLAFLAVLSFSSSLPMLAQAAPQPVKVQVAKVNLKQACKCDEKGEVKASKVISDRCFLNVDVDTKQPIEPFAKMFFVMNQVKGQKTLLQVPDAGKCNFKAGQTVKMWSSDTDPGFLESTPACGHEPAAYASSCEPYGRYVTLYRNESLRAQK
ncbi:MAG: hypothetical protein EOP11_19400 [Proteobacteria bacterium]|nr:MAG: hypothetical protein EOP11_19400 [Pseudomonadota bacterium]